MLISCACFGPNAARASSAHGLSCFGFTHCDTHLDPGFKALGSEETGSKAWALGFGFRI